MVLSQAFNFMFVWCLVYLVYLVYLVCLVAFDTCVLPSLPRETKQTKQTRYTVSAFGKQIHCDRRHDDVSQRYRQHDLPAELHQLVIPQTWERRTEPEEEEQECIGLHREPGEVFDPGNPLEAQLSQNRPRIGGVPTAQKQRGGDAGYEHHIGILRDEEEREAHAAVFRKKAGHQLALGFRQVERHTVGLRHGRNHVHDERENLRRRQREDEPMPESAGLRFSNLDQTQRPRKDQHADDGQAHVELIADHLRGGPQPSQQRILAVGRPSAEDNAVGTDRGEGQNVENANIDVADDERLDRDAEYLDFLARTKRNDGKTDQSRNHGEDRREAEHELVRAGRDDVLLEKQFQAVSNRLEDAVGTDFHGAHAVLHPAEHFALGEGQDHDRQHDHAHDRGDLDQRDCQPQTQLSHDLFP